MNWYPREFCFYHDTQQYTIVTISRGVQQFALPLTDHGSGEWTYQHLRIRMKMKLGPQRMKRGLNGISESFWIASTRNSLGQRTILNIGTIGQCI
jgi:hypothetical protein